MLTFTSKLRGSALLFSFMSFFTVSTLFFYVHFSPIATTRFYNYTLPSELQSKVYLTEKPSTFSYNAETVSFSALNRYREPTKTEKQNTIVVFTPFSRHFGHKDEKIIARKYNIQFLHFDLPGFGYSTNYKPENVVSTLKKMKITNFSIFAQSLASNFALEVSALIEKDSSLKLDNIVLFSPWSVPKYSEDWKNFASGHKQLTRLFQNFPFVSDYILKILAQFGFITRSEYWYINLSKFLANGEKSEDMPLIMNSEWQPVLNNSFVEVFRQGVGPFIDLYKNTINSNKIPKLQSQIHIFHALHDETVPFAHSQRLKNALSNVNLVSINGSGHFKVFDENFEKAIRDIVGIKESDEQNKPHVFVIGGGLAGLSAAIESASYGAIVTLLEKEDRVNGNSAKASSGINGALTNAQKTSNITDSFELFYNDTMASGKGSADSSLVDALVKDSSDAISFFEKRGINMDVLSILGGHSVARTHRPRTDGEGRPKNAGADIMYRLFESAKSNPNIRFITRANAKKLIKENNKIVGVEYEFEGETKKLEGGPVVLATGGYSADREGYLKKYFQARSNIPTSNGAFATGDGIKMGEDIGAGLKHMSYVQIHPTCYLDPKDLNATSGTLILAAEALRGYGSLLVNSNGARFCNEIGLRDETSEAIFKHCTPAVENGPVRAYMLMNDKIIDDFGRNLFSFYQNVKGLVIRYENFEEMISKEKIPEKKLKRTIEMYNSYADAGRDPFKKSNFPTKFNWKDPIYVSYITPCIHYSMGGLSFSPDTRVLDTKGKSISGLFAAGEVTGGLHGKNRLGGNSLLECVVFGRRAGHNSVESQYVDKLEL